MKHISNYGLMAQATTAETATTARLSNHVNSKPFYTNRSFNTLYNNNNNNTTGVHLSSLLQRSQRLKDCAIINGSCGNESEDDGGNNDAEETDVADEEDTDVADDGDGDEEKDIEMYSNESVCVTDDDYNSRYDANSVDLNCLDNADKKFKTPIALDEQNMGSIDSENESDETTLNEEISDSETEDSDEDESTLEGDPEDNDTNLHMHENGFLNNINIFVRNGTDLWSNYEQMYLEQMEFIENYSNFYSQMWRDNYGIDNDDEDSSGDDDDCDYSTDQDEDQDGNHKTDI